MINNILNQSKINKILNEPTINNNLKESLINNILNQSTINNNEEEIINNYEKPTINNNKKPIISNTFIKTPECIRSKRAVLNSKTNDNKSFQYSVTLSLYHEQIGKNFSRISNIKPYINNFNWDNINFLLTGQDYQNFEINNSSTALNILQMNDQQKIDYLYESKFNSKKRNRVIFLLLENKLLCLCKKSKVFIKLITFIIRV